MSSTPALPILVGPRAPRQRPKVQEDNVRERVEPPWARREDPRAPAERANEIHKGRERAPNQCYLESQRLSRGKPQVRASGPDFAPSAGRTVLEETPNQKLIGVRIDPPPVRPDHKHEGS